jgi:hypothetical protein
VSARDEMPEVEVERANDSLVRERFGEDLIVRCTMQRFVPKMKWRRGLRREATPPHARPRPCQREIARARLAGSGVPRCQPGRVLQGLFDVVGLEVEVPLTGLGDTGTMGGARVRELLLRDTERIVVHPVRFRDGEAFARLES